MSSWQNVNLSIAIEKKGSEMDINKFYYIETFKKIGNGQRKLLNNLISAYDVTYLQALILGYLAEEPKEHSDNFEITQKDIESYLSLTGATVTDVIKRMEESGYVKRVKSIKDGRAKQILITEKGKNCVPGFMEISEKVETTLTKDFTDDEREQLKRLLMKVKKNIDGHKISE